MCNFEGEIREDIPPEEKSPAPEIAKARQEAIAKKLGIAFVQLEDVLEGKAQAKITLAYPKGQKPKKNKKNKKKLAKADIDIKEAADFAEALSGNAVAQRALSLLSVAQATEQAAAQKLNITHAQLVDVLEDRADARVLVAYANPHEKVAQSKEAKAKRRRSFNRTIANVASLAVVISLLMVTVAYATPIKRFLVKTFGSDGYFRISSVYEQAPVNLKGFYLPQYIPEGFEIGPYGYDVWEEKFINRDAKGYATYPLISVLYGLQDEEYIEYIFSPYAKGTTNIFPSDVVLHNTIVDEQNVRYSVIEYDTDRVITAFFENGDSVRLTGTPSEKELLKVLESVVRIEQENR